MGWAQWTLAALMLAEVVAAFIVHGARRPPISFSRTAIETGFIALLLHAGGFWK